MSSTNLLYASLVKARRATRTPTVNDDLVGFQEQARQRVRPRRRRRLR